MFQHADPAADKPFISHIPNISIESTLTADTRFSIPSSFTHAPTVTTMEFQACARSDITSWAANYDANLAKCASQGANLSSTWMVWGEA